MGRPSSDTSAAGREAVKKHLRNHEFSGHGIRNADDTRQALFCQAGDRAHANARRRNAYYSAGKVELLYRDSAGRTRTERPIGPPDLAERFVIAEIRDPIAQVQYTLDPVNKVAHRVTMRPAQSSEVSGGGVAATASGAVGTVPRAAFVSPSLTSSESVSAPRAGVSSVAAGALASEVTSNGSSRRQIEREEDLGTQVMEGLVVQGTRFTTTVPVDAQGNDQPLVTVREQWVARNSGLTVLNHILDPRNGETAIKLTDISTTEPDSSMFVPPADYSVVQETGAFQINLSAQPRGKQ